MRAARRKRLFSCILVAILMAGTTNGMFPGIFAGIGSGIGHVSADTGYTVTYDGNGHDGGRVPVDWTFYKTGEPVIVHDNSEGLTKNGYVFVGWNTAADGTGTDYIAGQTFTMGAQNVTLYAKWVDPTVNWMDRSSVSNNLKDVVFIDGVFYAVGKSGTIVSSIDGSIWTKKVSGTNRDLNAIIEADGKLIAVGASGTILVSPNGEDWSYRYSGSTETLNGIAYHNGVYVAVGSGGTVLVSENGSSWAPVQTDALFDLYDVTYALGKFIAVGQLGTILTSVDGKVWNTEMFVVFADINAVAAGTGSSGEIAVIVGAGSNIWTSSDGDNWNGQVSPASDNWNDVVFANGRFVIVGDFRQGLYSSDGVSWTKATIETTNLNAVAYGNDLFVAVGNAGIQTSPDGELWTAYKAPDINGMAYGNGTFVVVGSDGGIFTSVDGALWKREESGTAEELRDIVFANWNFVAVGDAGTILSSSDGTQWFNRSISDEINLRSIAYGGGYYVAVGDAGTVVVSFDAWNWYPSNIGLPNVQLNSVAYAMGQFVAAGPIIPIPEDDGEEGSGQEGEGEPEPEPIEDSMIYTSSDGENWTGTTITGVELFSVAGNGDMFIAVGFGTEIENPAQKVYTSTDGANWSPVDSGISQRLNGTAIIDGSIMLLGNGGTVTTAVYGGGFVSNISGIPAAAALQTAAAGNDIVIAAGKSGAMVMTRRAPTAVNYTIHFDENGGDQKANPPFMMFLPGESLGALPAPPEREGYLFTGWNTQKDGEGTEVDESYEVSADGTVYAQWELKPAPPFTPGNLTAEPGETDVELSWDEATGADSYTVYLYEGDEAPANPNDWDVVQDGITVTSFKVTDLTFGTTYTFAVQAVNQYGTSDFSGTATATPGGKGTQDDPYIVSSADRLNHFVRDHLDAHFVLTEDIDLSDEGIWTPIGWTIDPFTGHFDGNGHTISGLTVRDNLTYSGGLFAAIGSGGKVQNLVLENVDISVTPETLASAGALAGELAGEVRNVHVTSGSVMGGYDVGGLVGIASGGAVIAESCAHVKVDGAALRVGGLVGLLEDSTVYESCATGDVSGGADVGGLAGYIEASEVSDSYASGSVSGYDSVGGLIGGVQPDLDNWQPNSTLERVHAVGKVQMLGEGNAGGLIGDNTSPITLISAYYSREKTGQSDERQYSGTPLDPDEIEEDIFENWDFDTLWHLDYRDGMPTFLRFDDQAPVMYSAKVKDETANQVFVRFSEKIDAEEETLDRFTVTVDGDGAQITDRQLNEKGLTLTLAQAVLYLQEVEITYTDGDPDDPDVPAITDKKLHRMTTHTVQAVNEVESNFKIVSVSPQNKATGVERDADLVVTFSNTVQGMPGKYIRLIDEAGKIVEQIEAVSAQVQVAGEVVTISHNSLQPLTGYHVLIDDGAFQHSANEVHRGIENSGVWSFITEPDPQLKWETIGAPGFSEGAVGTPALAAGADGTLYVLFRDKAHDGKATAMKLGENDAQWTIVGGAGFSPGAIGVPALLEEDGVLYAAFGMVDDNHLAAVHVMKYEPGGEEGWKPVGAPIAVGQTDPEYLTDQDSTPFLLSHNGTVYLVYRSGTVNGNITVKKLNAGGNWETVGNAEFSFGDIYDPSLVVFEGELYAGYTDYTFSSGYGAAVMKFNAAEETWEPVGSPGFTSGNAFDTNLVTDGSRLYVVYENRDYKAAAMFYDFDKGEWKQLGKDGFSGGQAFGISAAALNGGVYAAYQDASKGNRLTVMKFAGSGWVPVASTGISSGQARNPSLIFVDGILHVAYEDQASGGRLTVMRYGDFVTGDTAISPEEATFDKYKGNPGEGKYADVKVTATLNGNTLYYIWNGASKLSGYKDYSVSGNVVTIRKEYLEKLPVGTAELTFEFSSGDKHTLEIEIDDTTPPPPDAPVLLSAEADNRQVTVTWSTVEGVAGYTVFSSTTSQEYEGEGITVSASVYSYTFTGLTNGTTYYFMVKSFLPYVYSEPSNEKSATPRTIPAAPTNVRAVAGDRQATVSFDAPADDGGSEITGYEVTVMPGETVVTGTASPIVVTGLTNGTSYTFTVRAINIAGKSDPSAPSNAVVPYESAYYEPEPEQPDNNVTVLVNGKQERMGTASTSTRGDQTVITVVIDPARLIEKLAEEGLHAVVTIPVPSGADVAVGELTGRMVKNMEEKQAVLEILTDRATYTLPALQINIDAVSALLGEAVELEDIRIQVEIGEPSAETAQIVDSAAGNGAFEIVVPPVEFIVRAVYNDTTIEISQFEAYVERTIAIPEGVDPARITTGVVIGADGTARHVPTRIIEVEGRYYAVINSLTNSAYAVVWNPVEFADVAEHWAKDTANNMGSRMIMEGTGGGLFRPDRDMTRAEFAAMLVRALGLPEQPASAGAAAPGAAAPGAAALGVAGADRAAADPKADDAPFKDVKASDWFSGAVLTAHEYGLINGFADGTFRPDDRITREQAMVMISKAMELTGLKEKLPGHEEKNLRGNEEILREFADAAKVSGWAIVGVADSVQAGIVTGRTGGVLAPKDSITRAEAAAMVERLLKYSGLI